MGATRAHDETLHASGSLGHHYYLVVEMMAVNVAIPIPLPCCIVYMLELIVG
jgi:hypothetical protein